MANQSPKPCNYPACPALVYDGSYCDKHKITEGSFADPNRGTRQQRGYGSAWMKIRKQALERDTYLCQVCAADGFVSPARAVDHIVPKFEGGTDDLSNLQAICDDCHKKKTAEEAKRSKNRRKNYHRGY